MFPRLSYADVSDRVIGHAVSRADAGVGFSVLACCKDLWNLIARELIEVRAFANGAKPEARSMGMVLSGRCPFEVVQSAVGFFAALVVHLKVIGIAAVRRTRNKRLGHDPMEEQIPLLPIEVQAHLEITASYQHGFDDLSAYPLRHPRSGRYDSWKAANSAKVADFVALIKRLYRNWAPDFFRLHKYLGRQGQHRMIMSQTLGAQA